MTAKKDCTKTICPLCERKCQEGSTSSGFIENNGVCLHCVFGKTQEQINELIAAKGKNAKLKNKIKKGVLMGLDLGTKEARGLIVIKKNCTQNVDVAELNSVEIDNSCDCAACQHRRNSDEMKIKSPAIFEGYEVSKTFIRNENAYICDGGYAEEVTIKRTWQKPDGSAWVTFLSNMRMGFLDMQLADFAKKYKAKPVEAAARTEAISESDAPISKSKVYFEKIKINQVVGSTRESDERRFFYITFSYFVGGKRGHRKGYSSHRTSNNEMFNIEKVTKEIKKGLKQKNIKTVNVLIENWKEVNRNEYIQLMRVKI